MKQQNIIVYGAGGHGKVVAEAIEQQNEYSIAGFLDDTQTGTFYNYSILGGKDHIAHLKEEDITVAIVTIGDALARKTVQELLTKEDISIATIIHPTAHVARGASLGKGTVVLPQSVVGADTSIGRGCIINTGSTVDHDCNLEDFVHIAPGAHLAGNVHIGNETHIGIGSCAKEGVTIGEQCVIGAGSVVINNIEAQSVAYGIPAERIRANEN